MKGMNLRPSFRYNFSSLITAAAVFYAIITVVVLGIYAGVAVIGVPEGQEGDSFFGGFGIAACIMMFVTGICTVRDSLRLGIQHGTSRRTSFWAMILAFVSVNFLLAIAGEALTAVGQALSAKSEKMYIYDLYQMMFMESFSSIGFTDHVKQAAFSFMLLIFAALCGMFISLMFYRLSKKWTVVVAVGVPVCAVVLPPVIISILRLVGIGTGFATRLTDILVSLIDNPLYAALAILAACAMLLVFNRLLVRRATLKPA